MGEGQQDPRHQKFPGPPFGDPGEQHVRPAVRRPRHRDVPPPDPPGRLTPLECLVDRLFGGQPNRDMFSGIGPRAAILGFGGGEETIEDVRAFVGQHGPRARNLDEVDPYSHRAHWPARHTKRRPRDRVPAPATTMMYATITTPRAPLPRGTSQNISFVSAGA